MVVARRQGSAILYGAIALVILQAGRAALLLGLTRVFTPLALPLLILRAFAFVLVAAGFCLVAKPSCSSLGLRSPARGFVSLGGTALFGSLWLALLGVSTYFGISLFAEKAFVGLVVPFAEEALFRGLLWGAVEEAWERQDGAGGRSGGWIMALGVTTALYAFWHLGYADIIASGLDVGGHLTTALGKRGLVALGIGLVAGLARARSKSIWLPFFIHGIWNILAP